MNSGIKEADKLAKSLENDKSDLEKLASSGETMNDKNKTLITSNGSLNTICETKAHQCKICYKSAYNHPEFTFSN